MNLGGWGAQEELEWEKGYIFSAQVWSSEEILKATSCVEIFYDLLHVWNFW